MRERLRRFLRRYRLAIAIPLAFITMWVALWNIPPTHAAIMTGLVTQELMLDLPVSPLNLLGAGVVHEEVALDVPQGRGQLVADVYRPDDGDQHGALLLSIGAARQIRDNPGVIKLGNALARAGIVVMVPELYYPYKENTLPDEVQDLVSAFQTNVEETVASCQWLESQPYVDAKRAGIAGFSAGGGIALIAAADSRVHNDVRFLSVMGTYFDMVDLVNAITTESYSYDGQTTQWVPLIKSVRVLHRSIIAYLPDQADRDLLTRIFLDGDEAARSETASLTPEGRKVYEAFTAKDPEQVLAFWNDVSPQDVQTLHQVSPSAHLAGLHTELFIMTARHDHYIPYVESRRLRDATSGNGNRVHYTELDIFSHVEPTSVSNPLGLLVDILKLLYYMWQLMLRLLLHIST